MINSVQALLVLNFPHSAKRAEALVYLNRTLSKLHDKNCRYTSLEGLEKTVNTYLSSELCGSSLAATFIQNAEKVKFPLFPTEARTEMPKLQQKYARIFNIKMVQVALTLMVQLVPE